ncbi:hypothetical protein [Eisenibacter elegans]|uniref:hypothetical protein n=1 Tax=Eisenibacter elegans TaxID=997 RepID=UPI000478F3FD|nr:hypothetical protein [Eisenibacter elegans]
MSFILDDTYFIGGVNSSGIYYSNNFRNLSYKPGFSLGVEQYFPLKGKVFLSSGFNISQRNFSFLKEEPNIEVNNLYLDLPLTAAFELPNYTFLDSNQSYLDRVGSMAKHWNDSLFTIYRDNPFDFRKLETKISEGLQNASNILLRYYANQLLNAKSCEQIKDELNKIIRLNNRVEYLVKNPELDNVQQLNKVLRRERVPNRIGILLEL